MDAVDIILRFVGAFYAFAGYVGTRATLTSYFLDKAIAAIAAGKPSRAETGKAIWLLCASTVIMVGGIMLMLLLDMSVVAFSIALIGQVVYVAYVAPRYFDVDDPPEAVGRQRSVNALVLYGAATAFVLWAAYTGRLLGWQEVPWVALAVAGTAVAAHAIYIYRVLGKPLKPGGFAGFPANDDDPTAETELARSKCKRIKVMADYHCYPLWALDEEVHGDFPPHLLDISPGLVSDLADWSEAFTAAKDPDNAFASLWNDDEQKAHQMRGRELAQRLANERPDLLIYVLEGDTGVVQVHPN
jgi:hypothetical protein